MARSVCDLVFRIHTCCKVVIEPVTLGFVLEIRDANFEKKKNVLLRTNDVIFVAFYSNRVAVQLQKNLDRIRLRRIAFKFAQGSRTGGFLGGLPGQLPPRRKKEPTPGKLKNHHRILYHLDFYINVFVSKKKYY